MIYNRQVKKIAHLKKNRSPLIPSTVMTYNKINLSEQYFSFKPVTIKK